MPFHVVTLSQSVQVTVDALALTASPSRHTATIFFMGQFFNGGIVLKTSNEDAS